QVYAVEPVNLLDARGRGHVDLGQVSADYVEPDEIQPISLKPRPHHVADGAVARGDLGLHAIAADVDVAAVFVVARHAQRASEGLAIKDNHPLVAVTNFSEVALGHDRPRLETGDSLENGVEVAVGGRGEEHAFAAMPVERLDDHLS